MNPGEAFTAGIFATLVVAGVLLRVPAMLPPDRVEIPRAPICDVTGSKVTAGGLRRTCRVVTA